MPKIIGLGDSLTGAIEVGLTDRWLYKLGIAAGYAPADIINAGISGNRSDQMLARLQTDVLAHNPDVLVLMLTVNDKTNNFTLATHEANYRAIIGQAQAAGIKVVVMSPPLYTQNLADWRVWVEKGEQIAGDTGCHYVDIWREFVYASYYRAADWYSYYYVDYVHQTANGNSLIFSVTQRATHAGAFVKSAASSDQPPVTAPATPEITLALADLAQNGATKERLQRAISAMS